MNVFNKDPKDAFLEHGLDFSYINNSGGVEDTNHYISEEVDHVDEETGNSIGKGDKDKGNNHSGEGILDGDNCLGIDLGTKHDHKT